MRERILELIEEKEMNLATFADTIGVERSTMSHIKSGRSKPSLDVAQKILEYFPEVSSDWLILGKGTMFGQKNDSDEPNLFDNFDVNLSKSEQKVEKTLANSVSKQNCKQHENAISRQIARIIVFYDDGTFEQIERKG